MTLHEYMEVSFPVLTIPVGAFHKKCLSLSPPWFESRARLSPLSLLVLITHLAAT